MRSARRYLALALTVAAAISPPAHSVATDWIQLPDWELDLDARLVSSDGQQSFVNGGLGTLRYDHTQSGLRFGRARFALSESIGELWSLRLDATAWADHDRNPVDLTEAYLQFRPYPVAGYRLRIKAGAFYAPISLENRAPGWESPYTLSYSAINTWLGEELRTIGAEGQIDWLGTKTGHDVDVGLTAGVYGWNDPAGVVLANRGFGLSDRQTTLFGRVGAANRPGLSPMDLFYEIDHRAGYYVGLEGKYLDRVVIRALHYDNRADPAAVHAGMVTGEKRRRQPAAGAGYPTGCNGDSDTAGRPDCARHTVQVAAKPGPGVLDFAPLIMSISESDSWVRETAGPVAARSTRAPSASPVPRTRPRRKPA